MRRGIFIVLLAVCLFPCIANALNASLKQKYPHALLTDDHELLNEIDLDSELDGMKYPPLFSTKAIDYIYWQCFPREAVTVSLKDLGYSPEDDPESDVNYNGENKASITIVVRGKKGIFHQYTVWGKLPIMQAKDQFDRYLMLMREEPYVCLAGAVGMQGEKQQINWDFVKMKTKKGCEASPMNGCHYGMGPKLFVLK